MAGDDGWAGRGFNGQVSGMAECPGCGGLAEPEQDGDVTYWSCGCGVDFGYQVVSREPSCQLGVPEEVRRGVSLSHLATLEGGEEPYGLRTGPLETTVFLGSIGPRPEDN